MTTYTEGLGQRFRLVLAMVLCSIIWSVGVFAQSEPEYKMEIGGGLGLLTYEGDFNGSIVKGMKPMGSLLWRRTLNPYHGFRVVADCGKIGASSANSKTVFPEYDTSIEAPLGGDVYEFSKTLVNVDATYEFNFWPYGTGREYRGAKRLTPFVFFGLGTTFAGGSGSNAFTANLPIGLGLKYKVAQRLNLNVEWAMHFSLSDNLDGVKDPYLIKSSGMFKNTDCYSALKVSLTYSFAEKCRVCHNADE